MRKPQIKHSKMVQFPQKNLKLKMGKVLPLDKINNNKRRRKIYKIQKILRLIAVL